jgi:hypothetical protein
MTNDIYYYKYLKYKEKYKKLQELCTNMEKYAVTMSDNIISNGKNIKLIFNYLDNWNECYQEAANFLNHKDYNLQYLYDCIDNLNNKSTIPSLNKPDLTEIIIVSIGSSSTQAYTFNKTKKSYTPVVIDLKEGKWYGVQNHEDKETNIRQIYENITHVAYAKNIKYIILHKSGSFGFKHLKEPRIIVPLDKKIPDYLQFSSKELEDKKNYDAFITLNQLIQVIIKIKTTFKWVSVGNFDCFKADWIENVGSLYFSKTLSKYPLYIMDFGGGSNSLKEIKNNNGLIIKNLFSGRYDQPKAISLINTDNSVSIENVITHYKNDGQDKTIKQQTIDTVVANMEGNNASIYIFQTGLQREFGSNFCSSNIKLKRFFTEEGKDIWSKIK